MNTSHKRSQVLVFAETRPLAAARPKINRFEVI
jgi:hypothetical protein